MPNFNGQLRSNSIFAALYNMIISQQVFADNIATKDSLVSEARTEGTLYGDTKLYYSTDALASKKWGADAEATNLLTLHRPPAPKCQAITLNVFRQISVTVDQYLTKQAWLDEGTMSQFTSVTLGWMTLTKEIHDDTVYNTFIGTTTGASNSQTQEINLTAATTSLTGLEKLRVEGLTIAQFMADLMVDLTDYSRKFNDYGFLRRYAKGMIKVVWNSKYLNKISYVDLPTVFHNEAVLNLFKGQELNSRYFGEVIDSSNIANYSAETPEANKPIASGTGAYTPGAGNANGTVRSLIEIELTVSGTKYHLFAGDELPAGATIKSGGDFEPGEVYIEDKDIVCKVLVKLPPFMSAFQVGTSFFNAKSLTENHYLTWGYNDLEYLKNYPMITVHAD